MKSCFAASEIEPQFTIVTIYRSCCSVMTDTSIALCHGGILAYFRQIRKIFLYLNRSMELEKGAVSILTSLYCAGSGAYVPDIFQAKTG